MSTASSHASPNVTRQPQVSQTQRNAEAKAAFVASLRSVGENVDQELQDRAGNIRKMDESLTRQEKDLQKETKKLARQNDDMQKFIDKSKRQLADVDNFEALHANLDADLDDIDEMLRMIEESNHSTNSRT